MSVLRAIAAVIGLWFGIVSVSPCAAESLVVVPQRATLSSRLDQLQLVVGRRERDNRESDRTRVARFESLSPEVLSVDSKGRVAALKEGQGAIRVHDGDAFRDVFVDVDGPLETGSARFDDHVLPILSLAGCNQGACHASQFGKGGFKLSVFGYAPERDVLALTREWDGRRLSFVRPRDSLILRKATLQVGHGGGRRFSHNSYAYEVLRTWIAEGARGPANEASSLKTLRVFPDLRTFRVGESQQLRVEAIYSDGVVRDVTRRTQFDSLEKGIAEVADDGYVTVRGYGQAAIMVRYRGHANVSLVLSPISGQEIRKDFLARNFIDEQVIRRWKLLGLSPSASCTDAEFLRRVFLDCLGTLPSPSTVEDFLASEDPRKRSQLVDTVLGISGDPERDVYVEEWSTFWTLKFGDVLRNNRKTAGDAGMWAFHNWIKQALRENKPYDRFTRDLITAEGSIFEHGPANFIASSRRPTDNATVSDPADLAESTAQVFLGIRLQCARCHHHPFESYSQADFFGLAAFFTRLNCKPSGTFGELGFDAVVSLADAEEPRSIKHPRTGQVVSPRPLGSAVISTKGVLDLRVPLADWLTSPKNRLFSRNIVNRIWGHYMGTGIVTPVDDLRSTNPPSNPELLDALADDFVANGFDLKQLMRRIMNSATYQLSSAPLPANVTRQRFYTHYNVKRLSAEVLLDAVDSACGTHERFPGVPPGTRAIALPDPNFESYFLDTLGRPRRLTNCECERTSEPNMAQVLHLANGEMLEKKLSDKTGRVAKLETQGEKLDSAVRQLYLATFSRAPDSRELITCRELVSKSENRRRGLENILWALCNSREFLFNH